MRFVLENDPSALQLLQRMQGVHPAYSTIDRVVQLYPPEHGGVVYRLGSDRSSRDVWFGHAPLAGSEFMRDCLAIELMDAATEFVWGAEYAPEFRNAAAESRLVHGLPT